MKSLLVVALFLFVWPFSSGKTYQMAANSTVPAASGTVKVQKGSTNVNLDIKVSHLAHPAQLVPPKTAYIVWVRPRGEAAIKKGAINIGGDLNGESKVVTTSKNFDVFITAEPSAAATAPSGPEILRTHVTLQ